MTTKEMALEWIQEHHEAGATIMVRTATRITKYSAKNFAKLTENGNPPFKIDSEGNLRMLEGFTNYKPRYVVVLLSAVKIDAEY